MGTKGGTFGDKNSSRRPVWHVASTEIAKMPKMAAIRPCAAFLLISYVIYRRRFLTCLKTAHILPPLNECLQTCRIKTGFGTFGSIKRRHPNNGCPFSFSGLVDFSVRLEGPCYTLLLLP